MTGYRRAVLTIVGLAALALLMSACAKPATQASSTTGSDSTSTLTLASQMTPGSSTTKPAESASEIRIPPTGSVERKALLDAARKRLSTTSEFVVHQLFAQDNTAIGEIEPVSGGKRTFIAWAGGPQWAVTWMAPAGSSGATAATAKTALPSFSTKLMDKIVWKPSGPTDAEIAAKQASLAAAAKKWSNSTMKGLGQPYKVTLNKVAQDAGGVWWGHIVIQPSTDAKGSYEPLNFWAKYGGGSWKGSVQGPEPPPADSYFPASVIPKLGL